MGAGNREITCQLLSLAPKAEICGSESRWEYQFDGVEVRLVSILVPLTCLSSAPSSRSKA